MNPKTLPETSCFCCSSIGVDTEAPVVIEITNSHGQHYFKATAEIGYLLGCKVEGQLTGLGRTREQALQRLAEERKKLADSLWEE